MFEEGLIKKLDNFGVAAFEKKKTPKTQPTAHRWNHRNLSSLKLWVVKQRLTSGCAADPRLRASRCEVKCSVRRRGPAGCGKHEVMKRGREGGYYSILRLIREGA